MALAEHLRKTKVKHNTVAHTLTVMSAEDRQVLSAALADEGYSHADIGRALRREGYPVSDDQVRNHRNKLKESL